MFNKKRIIVIISFLLLSFTIITFGGNREGLARVVVTFMDSYDNSIIDEQIITYKQDAVVPNDPYHRDNVFVGWYLYESEDTQVTNFTNIEMDLTVEARYANDINNNGINDANDTYYSVNFIDGVTRTTLSTQRILNGMNAIAPTPLEHISYIFLGWDSEYSNISSNKNITSNYRNANRATEVINPEDGEEPVVPITEPEIIMYTLKFYNKEKEVFATQEIRENFSGTNVNNIPIYKGYHLVGWFTEENGNGNQYEVGDIVTSNLDLYGYWGINEYNISFDTGTGNLSEETELNENNNKVNHGTKILLPNANNEYILTYHLNGGKLTSGNETIKTNPTLKGWCKNSTTCLESELLAVGSEVDIEENTIFHAIWNRSDNITVAGATKEQTETMSYAFLGWSTIPTGNVEINTNNIINITSDVDLYAKYSEKAREYEVVINPGDGEIEPDPENPIDEEQPEEYGNEITLPTASKNYTLTYELNGGAIVDGSNSIVQAKLLGWCKNSTTCSETELLAVGTKVVIDSNVIYNAIWGASETPTTIAKAEKEMSETTIYTFEGWSLTLDGLKVYNGEEQINLDRNMTLYAKYSEKVREYEVVINPGDGEIEPDPENPVDEEQPEEYGNEIILPTASKNYTLTYDAGTGTLIGTTPVVVSAKLLGWCKNSTTCSETELLAVGTKVVVEDDVAYNAIWGASEIPTTIAKAEKEMSETTIYTFEGWMTRPNGEVEYSANAIINLSNNLNLYAKYSEKAREYEVIINPGDGEIEPDPENPIDEEQPEEYGNEITLPTASKTYTLTYDAGTGTLIGTTPVVVSAKLLGWCKNSTTCSKTELLPVGTKVVIDNNVTYNAVWGASEIPTTIASAEMEETIAARYKLLGWATTSNGEVLYTESQKINLNTNLDLYAIYKEIIKTYKITLDPNGGQLPGGIGILEEEYGTKRLLPIPTKNYSIVYDAGDGTVIGSPIIQSSVKFLGWCKKNLSCEHPINEEIEIETDATYNAVWGEAEEIELATAKKEMSETRIYTFIEWIGTDGKTYEVPGKIKLNKNETLVAEYAPATRLYKVKFETEHETAPAEQEVEYNNLVVNPGSLETKGYTFTNWNEKETGNIWDFENSRVTTNTTLYASWTINKYEVVINKEGGTTTNTELEETNEFVYNTKIRLPEIEKEYKLTYYVNGGILKEAKEEEIVKTKFLGWCKNNKACSIENLLEIGTEVTIEDNATYNAIWGTSEEMIVIGGAEKENIVSTIYTFEGWMTTEFGAVEYNYQNQLYLSENINLYAKYSEKAREYEVIINPGDGEIDPNEELEKEQEIGYGTEITLPDGLKYFKLTYNTNGGSVTSGTNPVNVKVKLIGWCKNSTTCSKTELLAVGTKVVVEDDVTYNAIWGNAESNTTIVGATKSSSVDTNYTFDRWTFENDTYYENDTIYLTKDITLDANYNESVRTYEVKFENFDKGIKPTNQVVNYSSLITNPGDLEQFGYTFGGWYKDDEFETKWDFDDYKIISDNTIIYAKWEANEHNVNVIVTGDREATYSINNVLGENSYYVYKYETDVNITNITPTSKHYLKAIKVNNEQTGYMGTLNYSFKMPNEDVIIELIFADITEQVVFDNSPFRAIYSEEKKYVNIRLKEEYMTCNEEMCLPLLSDSVVTVYYANTNLKAKQFLLSNYYANQWLANKQWADDDDPAYIDVDKGNYYHVTSIGGITNRNYLYIVYTHEGYKYVAGYYRANGDTNFYVTDFYRIKL